MALDRIPADFYDEEIAAGHTRKALIDKINELVDKINEDDRIAKGEPGQPGETPVFQVRDGALWVSYDKGATFIQLTTVDELKGASALLKVEDGNMLVSYNNGVTWETLVAMDTLKGQEGVTPLFKTDGTVLEVSYDNGVTYVPLANLAEITGMDKITPTIDSLPSTLIDGELTTVVENGKLKLYANIRTRQDDGSYGVAVKTLLLELSGATTEEPGIMMPCQVRMLKGLKKDMRAVRYVIGPV